MTSTTRPVAVPFPTAGGSTMVTTRRPNAIPAARYLGLGVLVLACLTAVAVAAAARQPGLLVYYATGGASLSVLTACIVQLCRVGVSSGHGGTPSTHTDSRGDER